MEHNIKRIAVFASGRGTNAQNLISFFSKNDTGRVVLVLSDKKEAVVISRVKDMGVEIVVFSREELLGGTVLSVLKNVRHEYTQCGNRKPRERKRHHHSSRESCM